MQRMYLDYKKEMDARCHNYHLLEKLADNKVISPKKDLPNVSSGETAGLIRRMARNMVQNTPNVEILNQFDNDTVMGILADYMLKTKVIGTDEYSNDMQQNLFASVKQGLTLGFDCVVPVLLQKADGEWYIEYDTIHYRDVFPEPGATDVRKASSVFVRRYLSKGTVKRLIKDQVSGWDIPALRELLRRQPSPPPRDRQSNSQADNERKVISEGYEIVTWYSNTGAPFLTFSPSTQLLLRIEKNKHPAKWHPVFFMVLEKDSQQPLGKSQVELIMGRQEFQDLMFNGAIKLWYRNINPSIIGYGATNAIPNLSPGKYTPVSNPEARLEAFEVNTQTLMQFNQISQSNLGSMVNLVGSADQQMAVQAGNGFSATPQGVDAQQSMVDITTNNYQKAIESFFSHYCSYALTIYFQELKSTKRIRPDAANRVKLVNAGIPPEAFDEDGYLDADYSQLATEYFVRCIPGSLTEMEDEKQVRILQELFVPLSQAMPAIAASGDPAALQNATAAMQFIIQKMIELSGSNRSADLKSLMSTGMPEEVSMFDQRVGEMENRISGVVGGMAEDQANIATALTQQQEQIGMLTETLGALMQRVGIPINQSEENNELSAPAENTA